MSEKTEKTTTNYYAEINEPNGNYNVTVDIQKCIDNITMLWTRSEVLTDNQIYIEVDKYLRNANNNPLITHELEIVRVFKKKVTVHTEIFEEEKEIIYTEYII